MTLVIYDTETTGIKFEKDRIIEIAAYIPSQNKTFEMLVNPQIPIPQEATAIHHITDEMVKNAPTFSEVGKLFVEFCGKDATLAAHNNDAFDYHFLVNEFKRHDLSMPQWKFFDTLKWARRYRKDLPRHSLQFLREVYKIPPNNAHRALDDVIVLHQVFAEMTGDLSLDEILQLLNKPRTIQHMPFGKHQGKPLKEVPSNYIAWLKTNGAFDKPDNLELKNAFALLGMM